jgi:hypothetical protein
VRHLNNTAAPVLMKSANPSFVRNGTHSPAATRLKLFGTLIRLYSESCCRVTRALRNYILDGRSYKSSKCARGGKGKKKKNFTNEPAKLFADVRQFGYSSERTWMEISGNQFCNGDVKLG